MKRSKENLSDLYAAIKGHTASAGEKYGLNELDLEDVAHAAYLKAQSRLTRYSARKTRQGLLNALAFSEVMNELNRRNRLQSLYEISAVRLDAQAETEESGGEDEDLETDSAFLSDGGVAAESFMYFDEPQIPDWVYATRAVENSLTNLQRKIVRAFRKLWEPYRVRVDVGLSQQEFGENFKKIKVRFAQCLQGYHAWLAQKHMRPH